MMSTETNDALTPSGRGSRRLYLLAVLVVVATAGLIFWAWSNQQNRIAEARAAKALEELGALVIMGGDRTHVASVNLSTLPSSEALVKAIEHLPALNYLNSLDASRTEIADKHLEAIGQLSSLNSLSLNETKITDDGARRLSGLSNLESLYLASTGISDQALPFVQPLTSLRILDLSATKVTADLTPITELLQLEWLVLGKLKLADDALPKLAGLKSLRRLSLSDSTYSPESLVKLQTALPGLSVDR